MEISSSNQAQLAQFQRVQNQESQALNSTQEAQAASSTPSSTQAQNSTVNISQEARERFTAEQTSGTNDTVELQSSGSQAEKPR